MGEVINALHACVCVFVPTFEHYHIKYSKDVQRYTLER